MVGRTVTEMTAAGVHPRNEGAELAVDVEGYYRAYGPMVLRRCSRLLRNDQKAVDATQDVFVRLLRNERRLRSESPTSLLLKIATNVCLNVLRSERRRPEDPSDEALLEIAAADEPEPRSQARSALRRIFSREQESTRAIAVMHLVDGLTLEEVAGEVGLSVSGVRKRLRALSGRVAALEGVEP